MYKIKTTPTEILIDDAISFNEIMFIARHKAENFPERDLEIVWVNGRQELYLGAYLAKTASWKFWGDVLEFVNQ